MTYRAITNPNPVRVYAEPWVVICDQTGAVHGAGQLFACVRYARELERG